MLPDTTSRMSAPTLITTCGGSASIIQATPIPPHRNANHPVPIIIHAQALAPLEKCVPAVRVTYTGLTESTIYCIKKSLLRSWNLVGEKVLDEVRIGPPPDCGVSAASEVIWWWADCGRSMCTIGHREVRRFGRESHITCPFTDGHRNGLVLLHHCCEEYG
jgi:hypothetical protein